MTVSIAKRTFKALWGSSVFTDKQQAMMLVNRDDRYDSKLLLYIVDEMEESRDITPKEASNLRKRIKRIPKGVVVLNDLEI